MENYLSDEQPLDFDDFANQLLEEGSDQSPSVIHGGVCGVYAAGGAIKPEFCLAAISQALELGLHGELAENSLRLADITLRAMQDEEFDFHLFLPDDETEMAQRVQALSDWCGGFMAGFALVVAQSSDAGLPEEVSEVLRDVAAIAEASALDEEGEEEDEEEAENHFFELTEYLRFASLNLFTEKLSEQDDAAQTEKPQ